MKNTFILLFIFGLFSLTTSFVSSSNTDEWKLYKEVDGLKIYTKISSCKLEHTEKSNNYLLFKYLNTNAYSIKVSGRMDVYYGDNCRSCSLDSPNEYEFNFVLKPGESHDGYCSDEQKAFKVFHSSKDPKIGTLDKFIISNLLIKKQ